MDIFMQGVSEKFDGYRIIMAMDRASWHTGNKANKWKNNVSLFQLFIISLFSTVQKELHDKNNHCHVCQ